MSFNYIRETYNVPAKRGGRVVYSGDGEKVEGVITGTHAGSLKIRLENAKHSAVFHPTWELEYPDAQQPQGGEDE